MLGGLVILVGQTLSVNAEAQPQRTPTVLTIHWGAEDAPSTPVIDAAIKESLLSDPAAPVAYFNEYLESDRLPVEAASAALSTYIQQKYAGRSIDVVIAVADPAFQFVGQHRSDLFPSAPIVAAVLWGMFVAPKAARPLHDPAKLLVELVVFGAAAAGLFVAGQPLWAGALLVVYGANRWLLVRLRAM